MAKPKKKFKVFSESLIVVSGLSYLAGMITFWFLFGFPNPGCQPRSLFSRLTGAFSSLTPEQYPASGEPISDSINCVDTDDGLNYEVAGNTRTEKEGPKGVNILRGVEDECISQTVLKEYYCRGSHIGFEDYECPSLCSAGACESGVPQLTTTPTPYQFPTWAPTRYPTTVISPPEYSDEEEACFKAGGTWMVFPNSCADLCGFGEDSMCLDVLTQSCDCGPKLCWNKYLQVCQEDVPLPEKSF